MLALLLEVLVSLYLFVSLYLLEVLVPFDLLEVLIMVTPRAYLYLPQRLEPAA